MPQLRDLSIQVKLGLLVGLAVASALVLCCAAFVFNDLHTLKQAKQRQMESVAAVLGANLTSALDFDDRRSASETLGSLANQPGVDLAVLFNARGEVFATYPAEWIEQENLPQLGEEGIRFNSRGGWMDVRRWIVRPRTNAGGTLPGIESLLDLDSHVADDDFHAASSPTASEETAGIGQILIRADTSAIYQQIVARSVAAVAVLIVSLGVGLLIARLFQRLITSPIHHLADVAQRIGQERDYSLRAIKQGHDELGVLCDAFNTMLSELQRGREQLQHAHDNLEHRVEERTAELRLAMEEAQAANRAKSDFLANMSHEIRTPMTSILGYAELLQDQQTTDQERQERAAAILRNGKHLLDLINDVLDVSKIEAGKMSAERIECSVCELLADLLSLLRQRARKKGLNLELEYRGTIPERIYTDPTRLRQILVNLVGNAIKFTENGSVKLVVAMEDRQVDQPPRLQFEVIDTGIGLSREQRERVFQAFTQADESMSRRFGGTGLGLTISQGLARLLGGEIEVASELGRGSKFTVTVETGPLEDVKMIKNCREAFRADAERALRSLQDVQPARLSGRILLVEDGMDNQRLLSYLLEKAGAEVCVAENGEIGRNLALQAWQRGEPYQLIFMDMQMPVLDGYAATRELRDAGYPLPIVALTAHAMSHERGKCLAAGCDDYLTKPVDRRRLIDIAGQWMLRGRQAAVTEY